MIYPKLHITHTSISMETENHLPMHRETADKIQSTDLLKAKIIFPSVVFLSISTHYGVCTQTGFGVSALSDITQSHQVADSQFLCMQCLIKTAMHMEMGPHTPIHYFPNMKQPQGVLLGKSICIPRNTSVSFWDCFRMGKQCLNPFTHALEPRTHNTCVTLLHLTQCRDPDSACVLDNVW